jgi:hypothetical protein
MEADLIRWNKERKLDAGVARKKASLTCGPVVSVTAEKGRRALVRARSLARLGPCGKRGRRKLVTRCEKQAEAA